MPVLACVLTAKGAAAIAVIEVFGEAGTSIVRSVFRASGNRDCKFDQGIIYTGDIMDAEEIIDHVVVARTEKDSIEISCHGNPLIVEMIMALLKKEGAELVGVEQLLAEKMQIKGSSNTIEIEAEIAKLKAASVEGVRFIASSDLSSQAEKWCDLSAEQVCNNCRQVLADSRRARYFIEGCKAVLAGPPNSGKSTLLNCLAGRQKAIVTDIAGTTRDWVSVTLQMGELAVEVFDTAGLDESLVPKSFIDAESQKRSLELLNKCDIILLILDSQKPEDTFNFDVLKRSDKKVIAVFNKCDLGSPIKRSDLGIDVEAIVNISAATGDGIEELSEIIRKVLVGKGEIGSTICFTKRQASIIEKLAEIDSMEMVRDLINELLCLCG